MTALVSLAKRAPRRRDEHGNWFRYRAKVKDNRDAQMGRWAWDVFLVASPDLTARQLAYRFERVDFSGGLIPAKSYDARKTESEAALVAI